jgi:hypothetical protein
MASGLCEAPCWMVVVEHIAVERTASVVVVSKCSPWLLHCATLPVACGVASASQGWLPCVSRSIALLVQAYLSIGIRFFQKPAFRNIQNQKFRIQISCFGSGVRRGLTACTKASRSSGFFPFRCSAIAACCREGMTSKKSRLVNHDRCRRPSTDKKLLLGLSVLLLKWALGFKARDVHTQ